MTIADFEPLFRQHGRRLYGLAWQLTLNRADAEDAVQETFLRALRAWETYEERSRVGAWLDRILVNVVRELGRRRTLYRRQVEPQVAVLAPPEGDSEDTPERRAERRETLALVERALLGVPMSFREVLVLRHFEERSTAEVAALLDMPEATVRTRLKRGRDMLIAALKADGAGRRRDEP
jgi:RNA polymerase sigma-70 factor, ECF subfamily